MHAIEAADISKRFRLSQSRTSLKDRTFRRGASQHQDFWALQRLDLNVDQGETVGILGHNGSGKSTLLKCIAGILKPTTGTVHVRGRVASLLELGAGFHPDLTGRENVFINAAFLGITRKEIQARFDEIVAFAELDNFIDQQVKYYSSGMFVRLGFAVAVNVDPDILLVDEVLAVGDEVFQQKCLDRVEEFQQDGRTILFVTHAADLVRRICSRAVVLHHGEMVANAEPGEAIRIFREHLHGTLHDQSPSSTAVSADSTIEIEAVDFRYPESPERGSLLAGDPLEIRIPFHCRMPHDDVVIAIEIRNERGEQVFSADSTLLERELPTLFGSGHVRFRFESVPLLDGRYPVSVQIRRHHDGTVLAMRENLDAFEVTYLGRLSGMVLLSTELSVHQGE